MYSGNLYESGFGRGRKVFASTLPESGGHISEATAEIWPVHFRVFQDMKRCEVAMNGGMHVAVLLLRGRQIQFALVFLLLCFVGCVRLFL